MSSISAVVILGNLLFVVACGTVGVRLIRKAQQTQQLPELLLGSGLILAVLGLPMLGAAGMGRVTVGELRMPLVVGGLVLLAISVGLQSAFAWKTFRPERTWAMGLTASFTLMSFAVMFNILQAISASPADALSADATRSSVLWIRIPFVASYTWTALEGYKHFRMAQRRERIDIGDPVLTNRFMLWSAIGAIAATNSLVSTVLHAYHISPFNHPLGAAALGFGSATSSVLLILVFMPPQRYIAWLRTRHGLAPV